MFALSKYYEYSNCLNLFLKLKQELLDEVVPDPFMFEDVDEFVEHAKGFAEGIKERLINELECFTEEIMEANARKIGASPEEKEFLNMGNDPEDDNQEEVEKGLDEFRKLNDSEDEDE